MEGEVIGLYQEVKKDIMRLKKQYKKFLEVKEQYFLMHSKLTFSLRPLLVIIQGAMEYVFVGTPFIYRTESIRISSLDWIYRL